MDEDNIGAYYSIGDPVSKWGCHCVGANPTMWVDTATEFVYVVENATSMCETSPDSGRLLEAIANPTCSGFSTPINKCYDLAWGIETIVNQVSVWAGHKQSEKQSETKGSTTSVLIEVALPILGLINRYLEWGEGRLWYVSFCLGEWTGEDIMSHHNHRSETLYRNGCTHTPLVRGNNYSIISMMLPTELLQLAGLCALIPETIVSDRDGKALYFCVAYTECEHSLPTFALQISGTLISCLLSSGPMSVSSGGLSTVLGNAVNLGLADVGFGISLSGEFEKTFTVYDGSLIDATLKGNLYAFVRFNTAGMVPDSLENYLGLECNLYAVVQVGSGVVTETVKEMAGSDNPVEFIKTVGKATLAGSGSIVLTLKLGHLTDFYIPDVTLGELASINVVLSTQSLPANGLLPGAYFYAYSGSDFIANMMNYAFKEFGNLISAILPDGAADWLEEAFETLSSAVFGKLAFGLWLNTNSFGFVVTVPALIFGEITLTCHVKLTTIGVSCGGGYDMPKWISALWEGTKMVIGAISDDMDAALDAIETKMGHAAAQIGQVIDDVKDKAKGGAKGLAKWCEKTGVGVGEFFAGLANSLADVTLDVVGVVEDGWNCIKNPSKCMGKIFR